VGENTGMGFGTGFGVAALFVGFFGLMVVFRRPVFTPTTPPARKIPAVESPGPTVPASEPEPEPAAAAVESAPESEPEPEPAAATVESAPEAEPEPELPAHEEEELPELPPHESDPSTT
jgi:hypothetical protein